MGLYFYPISALVNALASTIVGVVAIKKNAKSSLNRVFSYFAFSVAFWAYCYFLWQISETPVTALFWCRMLMAGAVFIPSTFLHLSVTLINQFKKHSKTVRFWYVVSVFFLILDTTPLFVRDVRPRLIFHYWPTAGVAYTFFLAIFIGLTVYAHVLMYKSYRNLSGLVKNQIKYVFLGTAIGFLGGATNYLLWYDIPILPVGNALVAVYVLMVAYAIIKYRLMDIEIVIKKTFIFAGLFTGSFSVFAGVVYALSIFFGDIIQSRWIAMIPSVVIIVFIFRPLEKFLINITEKYLFQKKYDYKRLLKTFSDKVLTVLELNELLEFTVNELAEVIKLDTASILLSDEKSINKASVGLHDLEEVKKLIEYIQKEKYVSMETLNYKRSLPVYVEKGIHELGAVLIIPLRYDKDTIGVLSLGKKKSDEEFTQDDVDVLLPLAGTLSVAIKNAQVIKNLQETQLELYHAGIKKHLADMADGMSHQFNNRFIAITFPAGVAKESIMEVDTGLLSASDREKIKQVSIALERIEQNAIRGGHISKALLEFTRPKKRGYKKLDISRGFDLAIEMVGYKHSDLSEIEITRNVQSKLPLSWANMAYLQDMFFIVLDNMYDAIKQKGENTPKYKVAPNFRGKIEASIFHDKTEKSIYVKMEDNGIGMKPEILEKVRIAVPYMTTKVSSATSGYGAGICVLKRFVEFHNGKISYDSEYGKGTIVTIKLPVIEKLKDYTIEKRGEGNAGDFNS